MNQSVWRRRSTKRTRRGKQTTQSPPQIPGPQRLRQRVQLRRVRAPRRGSLRVRRRECAAGVAGGQAGQAASEAAIPRQRGSVRVSDDGDELRDGVGVSDDSAPRPRVVQQPGSQEQRGREAVRHQRTCEQPLRGGGGDEHSAEGPAGEACGRRPRRLGESAGGDSRRLVDARAEQGGGDEEVARSRCATWR